MPSRLSRFVLLLGALTFAPLCIDSANAQSAQNTQSDYPSRLIKIIVPFPPGGNPDLAARLVAERMSATFHQPVIIENRAGANGALGASAVAKAEPDGYTLLVTSLGVLAINPAIYDQLSYKPRTDFVPVGRLAISPLLLIAGPSGPIDSVQSLVAAAKKEPGKLTYSSSGVGSAAHMAAALFNQVTPNRDAARHVQGHGRRDDGGSERQHLGCVRRTRCLLAAGGSRQSARARAHRREAVAHACADADRRGGWHCRLRDGGLGRHAGARRHGAADRGQAQC
jgi:hypothetical protein